jgi:hypothetical protein
VAISAAVCEVLWLKAILKDLNLDVKGPIKLFEDNLGCVSLAETTESKSIKHTDIMYHFIRESWERKYVCKE